MSAAGYNPETSAAVAISIYTYSDSFYSSIDQRLNGFPANTADTAYKIKINVNGIIDSYNVGIGGFLKQAANRYVILDYSDSTHTFTSVPANALQNCTTLAGIILPNSVTSIGNSAFSGCTSLASIVIPNNVTSIGNSAFSGCTRLASITIGDNVSSIGNLAFRDCASLTSITIPASVNSIGVSSGSAVFLGCTSLTAINVDSGNNAYSSQDGILYNKSKTTLIRYPDGKIGNTFTIPDGITSFDSGAAFANNTSLTSITIPNSITSIGDYIFSSIFNLTSVTFATGSNISDANFGDSAFPEGSDGYGNTLKTAYNNATIKAGTYTRAANGSTWSKQ